MGEHGRIREYGISGRMLSGPKGLGARRSLALSRGVSSRAIGTLLESLRGLCARDKGLMHYGTPVPLGILPMVATRFAAPHCDIFTDELMPVRLGVVREFVFWVLSGCSVPPALRLLIAALRLVRT